MGRYKEVKNQEVFLATALRRILLLLTYAPFALSPSLAALGFVQFFFFNDTATTEIYTLSLHDALPISKDNLAAWVNGKQIVTESPMGKFGRAQDPWGYFRVIPIGKFLASGGNLLAAEAIVQKDHNRPPQAGFIALLRVEMADGKIERFISGPEWKAGPEQTGNAWTGQTFDDSSWPAAAVVSEIGHEPLGTPWPAQPVDLLRKTFNVAKAVRSARIYSTALGT